MEQLKLSNQICFPLYSASKEIVKMYTPLLEPLSLTYTQYIVMLVLWEYEEISMKELSKKLYLDSNTLTPVINKLVAKKYISKSRSQEDERVINLRLEESGKKAKELAKDIPCKLLEQSKMNLTEAKILYDALHKIIENMTKEQK